MASYRFLRGQNLETLLEAATVDCNNVLDLTKTKIAFEFLCPKHMEITEVAKSTGAGIHPCAWEVVYIYKVDQKQCNPENAKEAFQEILKWVPQNTKMIDKRIVGTPMKYKVLYQGLSCNCPQLHFNYDFILKKLKNCDV